MHTPENVQAGDKVLILSPAYVAGKFGVVLSREPFVDGQPSDRWLIQVNNENIVVSLTPNEFQVVDKEKKYD
ncbi:hypothetical protein [Fischerella sp. PCC 9605]|uniref:hypothetical protein n=1 Tax=Fischerella sp. PCC 9605 TaxID=1173024 RepID=UPI00047E916F|nr:hypothetical protein [Fischerella sp. PCC 9605]